MADIWPDRVCFGLNGEMALVHVNCLLLYIKNKKGSISLQLNGSA